MKKLIELSILSGLAACCAATPGFSAEEGKAKISWKISGELEEACSCQAACPCWFKSRPSRMTCDGVQGVFIEKGSYGKTPLDGLAMVQFVQSPEGKSMAESIGNWNFDRLYIDEKASAEQREALQQIGKHLFPAAAKSREIQFVPIGRTIQGSEHSITVGDSGAYSGHLLEGGNAGAPKISNVPMADPTHREYLQGETTKLTYKDASQGWNYEHSNYMYNRFKVDNKDYEKFEAEMAKKMAGMHPKGEK